MIVITGATGQLGRQITELLLDRVAPSEVGVSVRDPEQAAALRARGVRVRHGDFSDAASLRASFEGATQVLIVSASTTHDAAKRLHRTAIDAAVAAGASHIFYTSHMGADPASPFAPMPDHAAAEADLAACGVAYTSLRNGFYAASALMLISGSLETGELVAPQDGPVAWTTHADLAEAAALALTQAGSLSGVTPPLTAAATHDLAGLATIASELSGRPIRRVVVSDEQYRANLVARGLPPERADLLVGLFAASRRGDFAAVDPTLERLLGRPPVAMRDVLAEQMSVRNVAPKTASA